MKKILSVFLALIMLTGTMSVFTFTAGAEGREALTWPKSDYDFSNEALSPSPFLGELKTGSTVSSLLHGYYVFNARYTGYYRFSEWFRISDKIEGSEVTGVSYYGSHGPFAGIIYLEMGTERCIQFYDNSGAEKKEPMKDSYEVSIEYLGATAGVSYERDTVCPSSIQNVEKDRIYITDFPYTISFSEGEKITDSGVVAFIDNNTDIGKHSVYIMIPVDNIKNREIEINIDHFDTDDDGHCDICGESMTGTIFREYQAKIQEFFDNFFAPINILLYILTHSFVISKDLALFVGRIRSLFSF